MGVARVAVQEEAAADVVLPEAGAHHGVGDLVGHELTLGRVLLGELAELGAALDVGAEDVARRDRRDLEELGETRSLRALARALRAHDHQAGDTGLGARGAVQLTARGRGARAPVRLGQRRNPS